MEVDVSDVRATAACVCVCVCVWATKFFGVGFVVNSGAVSVQII
jgi:hypothetical protein